MNAHPPRYIIENRTPSGSWFPGEDCLCTDLDAAVSVAGEALHNWPDFRAWETAEDAPIRDATAKVKRALAARYEDGGYWYDTIPTALVDHASDELRSAHADDQAAQLDADCWRECGEASAA